MTSASAQTTTIMEDPIMVDETYELLGVMVQWDFIIYDMNRVADLVDQGYSEEEAMNQSSYDDQIGSFVPGSSVNLTAVSRDVQHGIEFPELDIAIALNRPAPGEEYGPPVQINFTLPNEDVVIEAKCHIFCGLGHDDKSHQMQFIVGNPIELNSSSQGLELPVMISSFFMSVILTTFMIRRVNKIKNL